MSRVCESARSEDRAASAVVGYVLTLVVSALFLTALTVGLGGVTETHTERMVTDQLTVVGQTTAGELERVDRLARIAEADRSQATHRTQAVSLVAQSTIDLPAHIGGHTYTITVTAETVVVQSSRPAKTVSVVHRSQIAVDEQTIHGGPVVVAYRPDRHDPTAGRIVVREQ